MARISVDRNRLAEVFRDAGVAWAADMGRRVVNEAKTRAPVDTGRLRSSIAYTVDVTPSQVTLRVGAQVPYARYVEEGTGIYGPRQAPIYPVRRQALKFPRPRGGGGRGNGSGGFLFAKWVRGMPPNPYLADALKAVFGGAVRDAGSR